MLRVLPNGAMVVILSVISGGVTLAEDNAGNLRAKEFWTALAKGDTAAMKDFYAPQVTLLPGSELLKQQWGIKTAGDRSKPLVVTRDELLAAYGRMIAKIGRAKWSKAFGNVPGEKVVVKSAVTSAESALLDWRQGDLVLQVRPDKDDNALRYVLRQSKSGTWEVVSELADY
jgi:hypothetical protein